MQAQKWLWKNDFESCGWPFPWPHSDEASRGCHGSRLAAGRAHLRLQARGGDCHLRLDRLAQFERGVRVCCCSSRQLAEVCSEGRFRVLAPD